MADADLSIGAGVRAFGQARGVSAFGGTEDCERVMVRYGDPEEIGYEEPFPIACLLIEPLNEKFAADLTHRDFLGALMSLQVTRDVIGDIIVRDKRAYVFCADTIAGFLAENLSQVRHTSVRASVASEVPGDAKPVRVPVSVNVSSERIDGIVAHLCGLARGRAKELFSAELVYVNGRACRNESRPLKEGDVVSVRGYGKFRYAGLERSTKKGRIVVRAEKYQ